METVSWIDSKTFNPIRENKKPINIKSKYFANTTGMSYYDGILQYPRYHKANKGVKGTLKMISPDHYIIESGKNRRVPISPLQEQAGVTSMYVDKYIERAKRGEKMPIPIIDKVNHEQEGRHRAMVAKKLGLKKIPVLFVEKG